MSALTDRSAGQIEAFRPRRFSARYGLDPFLLVMLVLLMAVGLSVLYSASGRNMDMVIRQALHFAVGFTIMGALAFVRRDLIYHFTPLVFGVAAILLVGVLALGTDAKGAQRWLDLPGLPRFQPSELMKLALPAMVAWWLTRKPLPPRALDVVIAFVLVAIPVGLIAIQPDLGTSILIAASGFFVLFLAGLSWKLMGSLMALGLAALPVLWSVMHDYQRRRVMTLFDPESDPLGAGWNTIQAMTALGSGGLEGKGFMAGTQAQLKFLPESHTDFIVAVIGEEFGFFGLFVLLVIYMLILGRALVLTARADHSFGRLLSGSITLTFFIYVFVNLGMVSGILPVVGVPLPLISYGGTSVVSLLIGFGLLMAMQRSNRVLSGES